MTATGTSLLVRDASTPHKRPHTTSKSSSNPHNSTSSSGFNQNVSLNPNTDNNNNRRHSLPLHFLPPSLWTSNTSTASLVESEEAARGEHILDEAKVANRLAALRSLNGANRSDHRYAKSTGETFNQPVIVRTYSGAIRPRSQQRDPIAVKKQNGTTGIASNKMDMKLPPVEAFSFKGIMDEIKHGVSDDLERIAEICARSKYSLANQHEFHHPLMGLEIAYHKLKKPAAVLEDEVRGRATSKEIEVSPPSPVVIIDAAVPEAVSERSPASKHARPRSSTFASMIIDNAQSFRQEHKPQVSSPTLLLSEPARPQTSAADLEHMPALDELTPDQPSTFHELAIPKPTLIRNESIASTLRPENSPRSSILGSLSSWLPWSKPPSPVRTFQGRARSGSHAEGSLRNLLRSTEIARKGKNVDSIP
ncbi:hypothetical protein H4I96_09417 [Botrytis cinerea]